MTVEDRGGCGSVGKLGGLEVGAPPLCHINGSLSVFSVSTSLPGSQVICPAPLCLFLSTYFVCPCKTIKPLPKWRQSKRRCLCWSWTRRMHWTRQNKLKQTRKQLKIVANRWVINTDSNHIKFHQTDTSRNSYHDHGSKLIAIGEFLVTCLMRIL